MNINMSINIDKHDHAHAHVNGSTYAIKSIIDINNKLCKNKKRDFKIIWVMIHTNKHITMNTHNHTHDVKLYF